MQGLCMSRVEKYIINEWTLQYSLQLYQYSATGFIAMQIHTVSEITEIYAIV